MFLPYENARSIITERAFLVKEYFTRKTHIERIYISIQRKQHVDAALPLSQTFAGIRRRRINTVIKR